MTDERNNLDNDALVTEVYRSLADERVPDDLNRRVLQMAARPVRTPYSRAKAWTTPLAWAATVGLSLALVLELTRLPDVEPNLSTIVTPDSRLDADDVTATTAGPSDESLPAAGGADVDKGQSDSVSRDEFVPRTMNILREAEEIARTRAGPQQATVTAPADVDLSPAEKFTNQRTVSERRARESDAENGAADDPIDAPALSATAPSAFSLETKALQSENPCPTKSRETPESWLACIATLRDNGLADLAELETREFRRIYPDLPGPRLDK